VFDDELFSCQRYRMTFAALRITVQLTRSDILFHFPSFRLAPFSIRVEISSRAERFKDAIRIVE
jgi:hypothetical protein